MAFDATRADGLLSRRRLGCAEKIALALAAVALSLGAAAWITDSNQTAFASAALPENSDRISSFEERFFPASATASPADKPALQPLDRFALAVAQIKVRTTRIVLDPQLMSRESSVGFVDEAKVDEAKATTAAATIPLPRSRSSQQCGPAGRSHTAAKTFRSVTGTDHAGLARAGRRPVSQGARPRVARL
jgi:hypothetical protein